MIKGPQALTLKVSGDLKTFFYVNHRGPKYGMMLRRCPESLTRVFWLGRNRKGAYPGAINHHRQQHIYRRPIGEGKGEGVERLRGGVPGFGVKSAGSLSDGGRASCRYSTDE